MEFLQALATPENLIALLTLASMEIVLGIDNIVLIAVLCSRLPEHQRDRARKLGISLAVVTRVLLLFAISWVMKLDKNTLFSILGHGITGKDLILIVGGFFLIGKATYEIHAKLEGDEHHGAEAKATAAFGHVVMQILMLDLVFSLDSVITAVGMVKNIGVMVISVLVAVAIMLVASGPIGNFVMRHPTTKMLALSFLLLIGTVLVADGFGQHVSKGYIYSAMGFSFFVEMLNLRLQRTKVVHS